MARPRCVTAATTVLWLIAAASGVLILHHRDGLYRLALALVELLLTPGSPSAGGLGPVVAVDGQGVVVGAGPGAAQLVEVEAARSQANRRGTRRGRGKGRRRRRAKPTGETALAGAAGRRSKHKHPKGLGAKAGGWDAKFFPAANGSLPQAQPRRPATPTTSFAAKYGFYIHAFNFPAAVIYQVREVKRNFPGSPIYIMSDGGMRFDNLCKAENCTFKLCPPANDRWHPWPFLRRFYDAAVALNTEFVILLEPDNTVHGPITRPPKRDAGGLYVRERSFGQVEYVERLANEVVPGFKWRAESMKAGLCGGSYFRTAAILDAFSDESVARIDWNYLGERVTKEVFSSDFAMPYLLAARGWEVEPWEDAAQMETSKELPHAGPADAAFKHYGGGYPGGKPTYNLRLMPADAGLVKDPLPVHQRWNSNCQVCYSLGAYIKRFGSADCTNHLPFKYSDELKRRYPGR